MKSKTEEVGVVREIELPVANTDFDVYVSVVKDLLGDLGYGLIKQCSCSEKRRYIEESNIKEKSKEVRETKFQENTECIHYGVKHGLFRKKGEGVVFVIESFQEGDTFSSFYSARDKNNEEPFKVVSLGSSQEKIGVVSCYAYGGSYEGKDSSTDFVCQKNTCWGKRLCLPPVVKQLDLREYFQLSDSIHNTLYIPENSSDFDFKTENGVNDLIKEFSRFDLTIMSGASLNRVLNKKQINAVKEVAFNLTGYPVSYKESKKLKFLTKSREIDVPENVIEGEDENSFFESE